MYDSFDQSKIRKSDLLRVAKTNPAAIKRLANYLRLKTEGYSSRQIAKLISWLFNKRLDFKRW